MATLYIVSTPIGNMEDITLRALRVLREVGLIAAEDTRTTRKLLSRYEIKTPLTSYHDHNRAAKIPVLIEALEAKEVALVSEAGMPGISDPGYELVLAAIESGVSVVPVPGPSALTASLAVSGLPAEGARFLGFLPRRKMARRRLLESIWACRYTMVVFEAPHRLRGSLEDMLELLGDRPVAICRELTKLYEEVFRGTVSQALFHFGEPRGEFTIVIGGASTPEAAVDPEWSKSELQRLKGRGLRAREAMAAVVGQSGLSRRELYRLWLEIESP